MLHAIIVLTRAQLLIARNSFRRSTLKRKIGLLIVLGLCAFGAFVLFSFTGLVVETLISAEVGDLLRELSEQQPGLPLPNTVRPLLAAVPSIALLAVTFFLVFSSFSSVLSSLYLAGDMDMLLATPTPMRAVFVVKFFGGLLPQYLLLLVLFLPVLLGYGRGLGYGPAYYLAALCALLLTPLLPAAVGALLVMAVVRVLPARRAREIVSILGGLIGVSFYIVSQLTREVLPVIASADNIGLLLSANAPLLPSAWAGRALVACGEGAWASAFAFGLPFALVSLGAFVACVLLAERLYYAGWSNIATEGGKIKRKQLRAGEDDSGWRSSRSNPLAILLPAQSRAILLRDLRLFSRDLRNLQQLIFPLALSGIWIFRMFSSRNDETLDKAPEWIGQLTTLGGLGIAFFVCISLSSALTGSGISREGKTFWMLKLAPISPNRLLLGKMALAYLPYPIVGSLLILLLALVGHSTALDFVWQWLLLQIVGLGCAAFGMGLGAAFPNLDWENPKQQTSWQVALVGFFFYPLYIGLVLLTVFGLSALGARFAGLALALRLLGWTLALALTGAVAWIGMLLGARGLEKLEV